MKEALVQKATRSVLSVACHFRERVQLRTSVSIPEMRRGQAQLANDGSADEEEREREVVVGFSSRGERVCEPAGITAEPGGES